MSFKRTRCPHCKGKLEHGQRIHPACIDGHAEAVAAKKEREAAKKVRMADKVERAETKRRKESEKTVGQRRTEVQVELNRWVRLVRDVDLPCISCGCTHARWNAGHYRSRGSAVHLSIEPTNVHKQCVRCNLELHGNLIEYRKGLVARYGVEYVEAIEADERARHYTPDEFTAMKLDYRARNREMKK